MGELSDYIFSSQKNNRRELLISINAQNFPTFLVDAVFKKKKDINILNRIGDVGFLYTPIE